LTTEFATKARGAQGRAVPILRPYQQADIGRIRGEYAHGARRLLYQAPTGSGKTVLFAHVVAGAVERGNRVAILGHRAEIVDQISQALDVLGVAHGIIAAGHPETPLLPVPRPARTARSFLIMPATPTALAWQTQSGVGPSTGGRVAKAARRRYAAARNAVRLCRRHVSIVPSAALSCARASESKCTAPR
jgi:hypothetical protein